MQEFASSRSGVRLVGAALRSSYVNRVLLVGLIVMVRGGSRVRLCDSVGSESRLIHRDHHLVRRVINVSLHAARVTENVELPTSPHNCEHVSRETGGLIRVVEMICISCRNASQCAPSNSTVANGAGIQLIARGGDNGTR